MPRDTTYDKVAVLEHIFTSRFDLRAVPAEIPFSRQEVRSAIIATGGTPPDNLNNFVKDLTRTGKHDPRSPSARLHGYALKEGSHKEAMGVFFRASGGYSSASIAITCPSDLEAVVLPISVHEDVFDLVRPDEGGLLAMLEYGGVLDCFFQRPPGTIRRVQSPVKVQPYEMDGFFVMREEGQRVALPCEAKSKTRDEITMNQIVGIATLAIRILEHDLQAVIPLGAKILPDGDVFLVSFPRCTADDAPILERIIIPSAVTRQRRFRLDPVPPKWVNPPRRSRSRPA